MVPARRVFCSGEWALSGQFFFPFRSLSFSPSLESIEDILGDNTPRESDTQGVGASSLGCKDSRGFCGVKRGIAILMGGLLLLRTVSEVGEVAGVR